MKKAFLCSVFILLNTLCLSAQIADNTALVGTVTDSAGAVVAGAHVVGVNRDTQVAYPGVTNASGYYSIPFVLPGTYDITIERPGFSTVVAKGAIAVLNVSTRTNAVLKVGGTAAEVTVSADTATIDTDDALLGDTISTKLVENLPMNTRRVMELAATESNVTIGPKTGYTGNPPGANFIGAGQREETNSLTLDGITIMNSLISNSPVTPNPDAVAAVQVQVGNFTAQYGAYSGVHINVDTKSGTNQFHGTAYDYIQNTDFDARSWTASSTSVTPVLRQNQFGAVLTGPVVIPHLYNGRDKLFFTGSYEGMRLKNQSQGFATLITDAERTGDFSALCSGTDAFIGGFCYSGPGTSNQQIDPGRQIFNPATGQPYVNNQVTNISSISATVLQTYQTIHPNVPGTLQNNYFYTNNNIFNKNQTLDRVDYHIGDKIRIFGRYIYEKAFIVNGSPLPTGVTNIPTRDENGTIGYEQIITPRLVNDARFGFNKVFTNQENYFYVNNIQGAGTALGIPGFNADTVDDNPGIPTFSISNYNGFGAEGTNWFLDDRTLHGYDQISYTRGKHSFMAGAEARKMTIGRAAQNQNRGQFSFTGIYSKNAAADFLTGYNYQTITPVFEVKGEIGEWRDGFFVQDNWQVSQKLTVQYGFRYELPTVPYSLNGYGRIINQSYTALIPTSSASSGATFIPTPGFKFNGPNHSDYGPRLGFDYRVTRQTVVRGGGGIYYNPNELNNYTLTAGNYPLANSFTYTGNTAPIVPGGSIILGNQTYQNQTGSGASSVSCVPGTLACYSSVFNINYYLPTPRLYQWNLDVGNDLWRNAGVEIQYLGSRSIDLDHGYYPNQPLPGAGNVNTRRPNQLFGQIRQVQDNGFETYHGLNVLFRQHSYHGLDANVSYTWSHNLDVSNDTNGGGVPMIQYNIKADYGNSNWDIKHRFVTALTYALPELTQFGPVTRSLIGGWQANAIITLQSGTPFNISISDDQANVGGIGTQRPNFVHPGRLTGCNRSNYTGYTSANRPSCLDVSAYSLPTLYTFGNLHRNDLHGPGQVDTNFSMFKNFKLYKTVTAQFRAEAFNLFNHPNAANPNSGLPGNTNGAFVVTDATSSFGQITSSQTNPRVLQLAGKINF